MSRSFLVGCSLSEEIQKEMAKAYVFAFSEEPWKEKWPMESALAVIRDSIASDHAILCYHGEELAGFGFAAPLAQYAGAEELVDLGIDRNSYYIKELVTAHTHRRTGVCSGIIALFRATAAAHHPQLVLRTRFDNRALFGPVKINGFREVGEYEAQTGGLRSRRKVFAADLRNED